MCSRQGRHCRQKLFTHSTGRGPLRRRQMSCQRGKPGSGGLCRVTRQLASHLPMCLAQHDTDRQAVLQTSSIDPDVQDVDQASSR
jgi:hypothetical protein